MEPIQKLKLVDITAATLPELQGYLDLGYVITQMVSLQPAFDKLLIVYAIPEV